MSRDVLITGASGFIGQVATSELRRRGFSVFAPDTPLEDEAAWQKNLSQAKWHSILHLAAVSSYGDCESNPAQADKINVQGTKLLCDLALELSPDARFILASTAQIYAPSPEPLTELSAVAPQSVYAKSKLAAEAVVKEAASRGLATTILRIFNHTHKTQRPIFFMPSVYQQLLEMKSTGLRTLKVGNVEVCRDIGAVSDLSNALATLIEKKNELEAHEIFNICSGQRRLLKNLITLLGSALNVDFEMEVDPTRYRASEPPSIVGSFERLHNKTGWAPRCETDEQLIESFLEPMHLV